MSAILVTASARATALLVAALVLVSCATLISRPLPPKVEVVGMDTVVLPAGEVRLRVRLNARNPNPYDLAVQAVEATIRIEDQVVAIATLPAAVTLRASDATTVEVEARPDFRALGSVLERMLRRLAASYRVTGHVVLGAGTRIDFDRRGELPLSDWLGKLR